MSPVVQVTVAEHENENGIQLPTEKDNTLKLDTLLSKFPECFALAYRSNTSNRWTGVKKKNEKFIPPQAGWGETKYVCVKGKKVKFKLTNLGPNLTRENIQEHLECFGVVEFDTKNETGSVIIKFITDAHWEDLKTRQLPFTIKEVLETDREEFTKRSGTTNLGHDFEELTMASILLNLTLDEDVRDFRLSSNDVEFGSFDDIVVDIELTKEQLLCCGLGKRLPMSRQRPTRDPDEEFQDKQSERDSQSVHYRVFLRPTRRRDGGRHLLDREVVGRGIEEHAHHGLPEGPLQVRDEDVQGLGGQVREGSGTGTSRQVSNSRGKLHSERFSGESEHRHLLETVEWEIQGHFGVQKDRKQAEDFLPDYGFEHFRKVGQGMSAWNVSSC